MNYSWHRRATDAIHHGALTNSKRPDCFVKGIYPTHVTKGKGCYLFDSEGKKYIDFICGLGTNLLGYAQTQLSEAIIGQVHKGSVYSLSSTLEVEAAEKLKELFPFVGKLRFLKTGTDACNASVRIAMAHTGRTKILSNGYHGWGDSFVSLSPPSVGVPLQPHIKSFTDISQIDDETACVILEPVITDYSSERIQHLSDVKDKCKKHGALLIFDEIITGFRFPKYSFSNWSGIQPDIILLGKCIGGGLPLSVVATKPGIGENLEWFISSTFAGETLSLAGLIQTISLLRNTFNLNFLWESGKSFMDEFNTIAPDVIKIEGYPTRGVFVAKPLQKALFFQESCKAGILFGSSFFFNFPHIEVRDVVINSCKDILMRINNCEIELEGEMPKSPFAEQMRKKES